MTAHIITFPADRCRRPASVLQAAEQLAYRSASLEFTDPEEHSNSIATMMRLACVGVDEPTKADAATWLWENCKVKVVE